MTRRLYVWDRDLQKMIPIEDAKLKPSNARNKGIIEDTMEATMHPSNGKVYDSKSAFRAESKARGLQEVGNDWNGAADSYKKQAPKVDRGKLESAYRAALEKVRG